MKTLQITDGDITLSTGNTLAFVYGKQKLFQDLRLWLLEPIGLGITSPNFGSILAELIGTSDINEQKVRVIGEIQRVLGLYQAVQIEGIKQAQLAGNLQSWNKAEILNSVEEVSADIQHDRIIVSVKITTLAAPAQAQNVNIQITSNGVTVS